MSNNAGDWPPACNGPTLHARAVLLSAIRAHFAREGVLEVETPLLCQSVGSDPNLGYLPVMANTQTRYLQTSPEFAMKRLLAAGSGSIFQICKAFRADEAGRWHNPEFSLLEWYRLGFDLDALMTDVEVLWRCLVPDAPACQRVSYRAAFLEHTGLDPLDTDIAAFARTARNLGLDGAWHLCGDDPALWLDLLFGLRVQPHLGHDAPCLLHHFPAILPSLARRNTEDPRQVERVELLWKGVELANGYHELCDAHEQAERFRTELTARARMGKPAPPTDERLLAALRHGLPDCAGMALGLDRLLALLQDAEHIADVLAFPWNRA